MNPNSNSVELGKKHYLNENDSKISYDDFQHFISTETRNWIIKDSDIQSDGSIPKAVLLPQPTAMAVKIRRFSFQERIN